MWIAYLVQFITKFCCAAGVPYQLIDSSDSSVTESTNSSNDHRKETYWNSRRSQWFYEDSWVALYDVLRVLLFNSREHKKCHRVTHFTDFPLHVCSECASSSCGILWNMRSLAQVPANANTTLYRVTSVFAFKANIKICGCKCVCMCVYIFSCVCVLPLAGWTKCHTNHSI